MKAKSRPKTITRRDPDDPFLTHLMLQCPPDTTLKIRPLI